MPNDHCPTCGQAVRVVAGNEGTSHFEGVERKRTVKLEAALRPVAELADRLKAKGDLDLESDYPFAADPDLIFPSDVELSITDLRRALAAFNHDREGENK